MKRKILTAMTATLIMGNIAPTISNATSEEVIPPSKENSYDLSSGIDVVEPPRMMLRSNQTEGGGSSYKYVSKQVVNLKSIGVDLVYRALLAGGLAAVKMGPAVSRAMITTTLSGLIKTYKYMRQTIYMKSDKKYYYYKVINEFSNSKITWKGPVKTSYQKVKR